MNYYDILFAKKMGGGVAPPEDSYQLKTITTPTSLATFNASAMPMPSLKVSVEAKQDLHGYDHPWVGGAGKNKLPILLSEVKSNNTSGTWSGDTYSYSGVTFKVDSNSDGYVTKVTVNGTSSSAFSFYLKRTPLSFNTDTILNGCPNGGGDSTYDLRASNYRDIGSGRIIPANSTIEDTWIVIRSGISFSNLAFYPMIRLSSVSDATFAPYSNICPISGWDEANVSDVDDVDNPTVTQTTNISLPQTVYGGELDVVNGVLKITDGYIASYNGETLPSAWISSMDEYAEGTSPTTGAEVCYELEEPIIINLTPSLIKSLNGQNNLSVDCGDVIEGEYFIKL